MLFNQITIPKKSNKLRLPYQGSKQSINKYIFAEMLKR